MKALPEREHRLARLRREVEAAGGPAGFARKYDGVDATYVSQLLNRHRAFGERAARGMEERCGWQRGHLDRDALPSPAVPALAEEQRRLLDVWSRLSKKQRVVLMDQLQATAASNIEIAEHLRGLGIKGVVPDQEVERKLRPGAGGPATAARRGGKAK